LRLPARLGGLGVPDVEIVSPVAYLSTLAATCRSVVDSLPDAWKLRLHDSRGMTFYRLFPLFRNWQNRRLPLPLLLLCFYFILSFELITWEVFKVVKMICFLEM
jgi:hypothetical protein